MQIKSHRLNYLLSHKNHTYFLLLLFFSSVSNLGFCQNVYDLALVTGISGDYGISYCPGEEVRFNNVIYNTGDIEACDVEITAYIPAGMSLSSNPLNSIWTVNGSTATTTIQSCIPPNGIYPNSNSGILSSFIEINVGNAAGSTINFYAEISGDDGDDIDSTPDNNPNNDVGADPANGTDGVIFGYMGDEDDHDISFITIEPNCTTTGCTDPCASNYDAAAQTDDGSCTAYSTACNTDICAGDVTVWNASTCACAVSVTQLLGCTDATAVNYNAAANCDNGSCTPPPPPPPAPPIGDYDLALVAGISTSYGTVFCPGDEVRFNTVLYNTGDLEACNVEITAYIPDGMSASNNPLNSIWTINGSIATANIMSCIPPGGVYPDSSVDPLSAFLILEITGNPGGTVNFYSEISQDDGDDIDSTPDNNPNNDAGAVPNTATDNSIYHPNDEDDHDVASITICDQGIYDLALITEVAAGYSTTVNPGAEVGFSTTVYNLGEEQACNVEVTAYIPAGMSLSSNPLNSIWTLNGSVATTTINTCIAPSGAELLNIYLTLNLDATSSNINFYAEISMDDGDDIDSTPDGNVSNDSGAIPGTGTDNAIYGEMGDEDDHDVAAITVAVATGPPLVYDLALITGISGSFDLIYCPGDEVRFNTVVYNTGDIEACNVEITAYIPDGMSVSSNPLNSIWTVNGSTATATINSCIPPGGTYPNASTDPLSAFLILEITGTPGTTINFYSEISMDDGDDIDSTPDNNPDNDEGAIPNTATDNSIYHSDDEDDHDVASIIICDQVVYDLALVTMLAPGYSSTVIPGDEVGFSITVYNQGEEQACNVQVSATIPPGMSFNSSNPLNSIWTVNGNVATTTINTCIAPGGTSSLNIYLLLNSDATATTINFFAEVSMDDGDDIDSTADNDLYNDSGAIANTGTDNVINGEMGDEDDHDVAAITVGTVVNYDLALINGISSTYGTVYCPGDEVRYNTVLYNVGDVEACNVQITAYIPAGMRVSSNPLNSAWTINGSVATTFITSCIPPGGVYPNAGSDPLSTFLILELNGAPSTEINFYSEISQDDGNDIDSTPDSDPNNDSGAVPNVTDNTIQNQGGDEDDHDVASITIGADCGGVYRIEQFDNFSGNKKLVENNQLIEMIYPTVSANSINVLLAPNTNGKALIQIMDVNGVMVYNETKELNEQLLNIAKIDVDFLSKGLYLVHVTKGAEIATSKFLKD